MCIQLLFALYSILKIVFLRFLCLFVTFLFYIIRIKMMMAVVVNKLIILVIA